MSRTGSLAMLASLAFAAITARAQAQVAFTYLSQDRYVEAYSLSGHSDSSDYCLFYFEENPGQACPRTIETDRQSWNDFGPFDAAATADVGGEVSVSQVSILGADRIHVDASLDAVAPCYGPGGSENICAGYGRSSTTVDFGIDSKAVVRFTGEVISHNYESHEIWGNVVTLRLSELDGTVLVDTTDETRIGEFHVDRYDQAFALSPGIYQFSVYVYGETVDERAYGGPGQLDVVSDLVIESAVVPEPRSSHSVVAGAILTLGILVVRRPLARIRQSDRMAVATCDREFG
jgi:hypothetical protein